MGYLDNSSVTIDAILTVKGRELLAQGEGKFNITQFALGDDEIDYTLWNTAHPLGTAYYGVIIDNMPVLEAVPDETQALRSKLVTLPKGSQKIPVVSTGGGNSIELANNQTHPIKPQTINIAGANTTMGYTVIVSDNTILGLNVTSAVSGVAAQQLPASNSDAQSISAVGFEFEIIAKSVLDLDKTATVTIIANETGGSASINVTVKKLTVVTN
jgi:hypothetical protein